MFKKYDKDFIWDKVLEFPIPTIEYIMRRTGIDMFRFFDDEPSANGGIMAVARSAKNYLFSDRIDVKDFTLVLENNIDLIYHTLEYILEFINFSYITGEYEDLLKINNPKNMSVALKNAKQTLIGKRKIVIYK